MQIPIIIGKKILRPIRFVLLISIIFFTVGHASAAVSTSACNKTANPSDCKNAFAVCDKQSNPDKCKQNYLNVAQEIANLKPPPESECNNTLNPSACKSDYNKCGNKSDKSTVNCKQRAIANQKKKQISNPPQYASPGCSNGTCGHVCGDPASSDAYTPSIDIGCKGVGNPIMDALFGIIRFLSDGVGLIVIGSIIVGGIQYTASRGDPQATALAINRMRSSLIALIIYIFAYAVLNYIIPGWVLR